MKIILFFILISSQSYALLDFEDATSPELIKSARALAMGNSFTSGVEDGWSAFYNPAGLGSVRRLYLHLANIHVEQNKGFMDATNSIAGIVTDYSKAFDPDGIRTLLKDSPGLSLARLQLYPNITYRYFSLGYMYHKQQWARLATPTSTFEIAEREDSGPVLSFNVSLWGGILKLGASAVYLTRKELQKDIANGVATNIDTNVDYKQGTMTYITAGAKFTLPIKALPTFSLVYRNSSSAEWGNIEKGGAPNDIPSTLDASFSVAPISSRSTRWHMELGLRDITDEYKDVSFSRKINAGMEISLSRTYYFRLGYSDGWGSAGVGVRTRRVQYDLSTYAVEAGSSRREQEDRRFALSISTGI